MIAKNQNGAHIVGNFDGVTYTIHVADSINDRTKNDVFIMARWNGHHWVSESMREMHVSSVNHLKSHKEFRTVFDSFTERVRTAKIQLITYHL